MAKGLEKHQARLDALNMLGRDLARRSKSCCELCEASGVALRPMEVPPLPAEPELERTVFLCDTCREQIENPKRRDSDHWRCLNKAVWGETPMAQALAVYMLDQFQAHDWAVDLKEMLYLEPEISELAASIDFSK